MNLYPVICRKIYKWLSVILFPLAIIYLKIRALTGKEDKLRYRQKLGISDDIHRPDGKLVWFHAASVGETNAITHLARHIHDKGYKLLITTVTISASDFVLKHMPDIAIHQFAPLDLQPALKRFFGKWRPDLAIFCESEIWPNMIASLDKDDIPLILVNGRISDRAYHKWRYFKALARQIFQQFTACGMSSNQDAIRITDLGGKNVVVTGNLKFDIQIPPPNPDMFYLTSPRTIWLAASTHDGEELIVAAAHKLIRKKISNILTIIMPRHPERGGKIAAALQAQGLKVVLHSRDGQTISGDSDIYIRDTIGELMTMYHLTRVAFVGGSMIVHTGHSPIEPAAIGAAIIYGPHFATFTDIYNHLAKAKGAVIATNAEQLAANVIELNENQELRSQMTTNAKTCIREFTGAFTKTKAIIDRYLL